MKKISTYISPVTAYLFILLFVYAAMSKLLEFGDFQTQLGQSPLLGAFAVPVSYGVIITELLISVLLAVEKTRKAAFYMTFTLMVMFTAYIVIILNFTPFTPCSCGGVLESLGWTEHLIFNIAFVALAATAILFAENRKIRYVTVRLFSMLLLGSSVVTIMFLGSEKEIRQNNAFQRKYMPHGLETLGEYPLPSNSFYIAGLDSQTIYLGNYNAPLYLKAISRDLKSEKEIRVEISNYDLPYKRVKIRVVPPYFYLGDGTVPVLYRGKMQDWKADIISTDAFFHDYRPIDSVNFVITTTDARTNENVIGMLKKISNKLNVRLQQGILRKQLDGKFDTDGIFLWNAQLQQVLYVYYYRNQYETTDNELGSHNTGKTIDTISVARIDVAHYQKGNRYKLGSSVVVNRLASTYGNYLFINSDRLGKYEDEQVLRSAGIIDQYDLLDNSYKQSFYLYHQPFSKISEIKAENDQLMAIVDDRLIITQIRPEYRN